jgi:nucleotide-binding universal stress UspA family protein
MTIKHILVPTDFSAHADAALRYALDLARAVNATVGLLHVVEDPLAAGMWASEVYTTELAGLTINLSKDAEERLRRTAAEHAADDAIIVHGVRMGRAATTIVEVAAEVSADLIVMGPAGRSGIAHVLMGSVAERVVRTAACPVLTVRAAAVPHSNATAATTTTAA